tara:strand:+ start:4911 stop:7487 length:2577 start_codon:yes stop_codon:yes gene_type:complete
MTTTNEYQLSNKIKPNNYNLSLTPDFNSMTFSGKVVIELSIFEPTNQITMNAIELDLINSSISTDSGLLSSNNFEYNEEKEQVTISFENTINESNAVLSVEFTGVLNDRLHGFYRSSYEDENGNQKIMACTQFEPTDARRAFPCWDEPEIKSTFEIMLSVPKEMEAISNMPINKEEVSENNYKKVYFDKTPIMSTYLLAFIIGDLDKCSTIAENNVEINIWATKHNVIHGEFALQVAKDLLKYYNEYFQIDYPLPKLDHLAIPDFAAGAMENWGAITYREVALLFDEKNSAPATKQRIAEIVAHEMAHMWFGDLVTMKWWNDLWLNESFASWMATKAIDHLFPEWNMWTQFIYTDYNSGLSLDGLENSHPIVQAVNNPSEINQLFDAISYSKGASIIRMLETYVGEDKFRDGLRQYMQLYKYSNAEGNNLWECIQEASETEIIPMMESWTKQTGYPVINITWESDSRLSLNQERFLYSNKTNLPDTWLVPISIVSGKNMDKVDSFILDSNSTTIDAAADTNNGFMKVNYDTAGFYRVNYPKEHWKNLSELINKQLLKPTDRLSIQSDAYALAKARKISATVFLELIKSYNNEKDFGVWSDLTNNMRSIDLLLRKTELGKIYKNMCVETLKPIGEKLGWEVSPNEGHLESLLRTTILSSLGSFGDEDTINKSLELLEQFFSDKISLAPELRSIVYNLSAQTGDKSIYNLILDRARKEQLQEEKLRLYASLCRVENDELFNKTLQLSISDEIRTQDTVSLLSLMSVNRNNGAEATWDFIKSNWALLDERYGSGGFAMMRLVGITGNLLTKSDYDNVQGFFNDHPIESAYRTLQQSLERIDANVAWLEHHIDEIESLLSSR